MKAYCTYFKGIGLALVILALVAAPAWPQSGNGSLRGVVQDETKAVIPNVTVVLVNTATGVDTRTVTNEAGMYVFPAITAGAYKVTAEHPGMAKLEAQVSIQANKPETVDLTLKPGTTQTIVSVQDVTPMVVTDNPSLGHTLERTRIEQLPLNGRSIWNLLQTVPGVATDGGSLRTYGVRNATHDVLLDGSALTDMRDGGGSVTRLPGLDSIQEFRVDNNAASAKYARQTTVVFITKGGSNDLHGSLFATNRDSYIGWANARARDNLTNTAAKLVRNEYGGTVGGPIWIPKVYNGKNRTFFFFSYEGYKQRSGAFSNYRTPTPAMKNGNFNGLTDTSGTNLIALYNPYTTNPVTYMRQQFAYNGVLNQIDPALESPVAKYIYSVLPDPSPQWVNVNPQVANNFTGAAPTVADQMTWSARFDQHISDKDQVYARMTNSMATSLRPAAGGIPALDGFGNSRSDTYPNKSISGTWTHSFSPAFFSEFMFSATRSLGTSFSGDPSRFYSTELGLPNPNNQPGYPVINNIGVGTGGGNYFQPVNWNRTFYNYFILDDNFTKTKGRHEFQFGVHLRYDQLTYMPQQQRTAGSLTFQAVTTGLYDPTIALPSRGSQPFTGNVAGATYLGLGAYEYRVAKGKFYMRKNEDAGYFQDNFRVTPRMTLNLGFRWQFSPYPKDTHNVFTSFDLKTMSVVLGRTLSDLYALQYTSPGLIAIEQSNGAKFVQPQDVGLPSRLINNEWHDVGPHIGLAYRALSGRKAFVIRTGYSLNYFPLPMWGWSDRMRLNTPFAGTYQNNSVWDGTQSPDGIANWGVVYVPGAEPGVIAGKNSATTVSITNPKGLTIGDQAYQIAWFDPNQPTSRVHDWNFTLEKELLANLVVRGAYVGTHSTNQDSYDDLNPVTPQWVWQSVTKNPLPSTPAAWAEALQRPLDTASATTLPYGDLQMYRKDGWGNSNGLQIELERRYSKGYGFQLTYNMINTFRAGGNGWYGDSEVEPTSFFLPGAVPADRQERMKMLLYMRDTTPKKHDVRWNWLVDLPFGKGKPLAGHANAYLNAFIGGWQVAGMGRLYSNYFSLPTSMFPVPGTKVQFYGHKYPIQDCRSGTCIPGYLLWNGYIPAYQINSFDANGKPNGYEGIPPEYKPAVQPLWPYPANYRTLNSTIDPLYAYYGGNTIWMPLSNNTVNRISWGGINPLINSPILSTFLWNCDASMFKSFDIKERAKLRVQFDFFNVFNHPGDNPGAGGTGIAANNTSQNSPRVVQLSGRLSW